MGDSWRSRAARNNDRELAEAIQQSIHTHEASKVDKVCRRPKSKFLENITLSDGSVVHPGQSLKKVWKVKNNGDIPWPHGCFLRCVGGDSMNGPPKGVKLPPLLVGGVC